MRFSRCIYQIRIRFLISYAFNVEAVQTALTTDLNTLFHPLLIRFVTGYITHTQRRTKVNKWQGMQTNFHLADAPKVIRLSLWLERSLNK